MKDPPMPTNLILSKHCSQVTWLFFVGKPNDSSCVIWDQHKELSPSDAFIQMSHLNMKHNQNSKKAESNNLQG